MKTMTDLVGGVDESELREELGQSFDQFKRPEELYYAFQAAVTACHEAWLTKEVTIMTLGRLCSAIRSR